MSSRHFYQGYNFVDLSTLVGAGQYRSRAAVVAAASGDIPSQHFLDFEVFPDHAAAQRRAFLGARAWIDGQVQKGKPAMHERHATL